MLTVNLISSRRSELARYRKIGEMLLRAGGLVLILTVIYGVFGVIRINKLRQQIAQTNLAKISFQDQANEVLQLRADTSELSPRVDLVNKTNRKLDYWRYLYGQVCLSLPINARLEGINASKSNTTTPGAAAGEQFQISGRADNAFVASKLFLALNTQPGFSDVQMGSVNLTEPHEAQFSGTLTVKPLPEDVVATPAPSIPGSTTAGAK